MMIRSTRPLALVVSASVATLLAGACASTPSTDAASPAPADGDCNYVNYHHDEAKNEGGDGKCSTDCDCDGTRTCASGACTGVARPPTTGPESCNSKDYRWNEAWSPGGAGKCASDCECDGLRTCTDGACTGTAR